MNGYTRFPYKTKLEMIKMYTIKSISMSEIANKFNVRKDTLKSWIRKYKLKGDEALKPNKTNKRNFNDEFKKEIVVKINEGNSIKSTAFENNLDPSVVRAWIKWYNVIENNKIEGIDDMHYKKFSPSQKLKVVKYCISNNNDFNKTASEFNLPYSTVYNWVKVFQSKGSKCFEPKKTKLSAEDEIIRLTKLKTEMTEIYDLFLKKKPKLLKLLREHGKDKLVKLIEEKKLKL